MNESFPYGPGWGCVRWAMEKIRHIHPSVGSRVRGFSIVLAIGKLGECGISCHGYMLRVSIGFAALSLGFRDVERDLANLAVATVVYAENVEQARTLGAK